jgi:transcriptional antiterminator NusG
MALRWYSISVLSNFEKKIAEQIKELISQEGLEDKITDVLVPTEEIVEVRRGKKITVERRFMPGYILLRMDMCERGYHLVSNISRVTGFLGQPGKPIPMRDHEVASILNQAEAGTERPRTLVSFDIGDRVSVTDGPFEGFAGMVEEVDEENTRLKVTVSIFGRATPVELEYAQVSKQT